MAKVTNVWKTIEEQRAQPRPRRFMRVGQTDDLMIALNYYEPGYSNEFHTHVGTSQSFLVLKGRLTIRTLDPADESVTVHSVGEGESVLVPGGEYYQLHNETDQPLVLYQAKPPADEVQLWGQEPVNARAHFGETA